MFKKAQNKVKIQNYEKGKIKKNKRCSLAPNTPTNILISGSTGAGKTNLLCNLIYDLMSWNNIYVYTPNLQEDKYINLQTACESAGGGESIFSQEIDLTVDDMDSSSHNIVVFDDWITTDAKTMSIINDYFIRGRKRNCTNIFLTQSYYDTPKMIRLNCNYFFIFKLRDRREIMELYKSHGTMSKEDFAKMVLEATSMPYDFLCIDKTVSTSSPLAYRKKFDGLLQNN